VVPLRHWRQRNISWSLYFLRILESYFQLMKILGNSYSCLPLVSWIVDVWLREMAVKPLLTRAQHSHNLQNNGENCLQNIWRRQMFMPCTFFCIEYSKDISDIPLTEDGDFGGLQSFCDTVYSRCTFNQTWILKYS